MKKFTKCQIEVLRGIVRTVKLSKHNDYPTWLMKNFSALDWREETFKNWSDNQAKQAVINHNKMAWEKAFEENYMRKYYDDDRNGIVLTRCASGTIRNLQDRGLIKIVKDSAEDKVGIDHVEVMFKIV